MLQDLNIYWYTCFSKASCTVMRLVKFQVQINFTIWYCIALIDTPKKQFNTMSMAAPM